MNRESLHASLRLHEGIKLKPYVDTEGYLTIGIGHNLDNGITIKQAYLLLEEDIEVSIQELNRFHPTWNLHNDERQNVLIELMFNLGAPSLNKFKKMWAALEARDYSKAAHEMLDSKWARQVGEGRSTTLSDQMRLGVIGGKP
tara:strand:- start:812 stop:1240 length:429 start_codon:yes stop_codon:yes gene_type:complete